MTFVSTQEFSHAFGVTRQATHKIFQNALSGKTWRGETLAVVQISGQQGGSSGSVWALKPEACSPNIRAKLDASLPAVEGPLNDTFKSDLTLRQFDEQAERLAIIAPILKTEKRTAERAEAFRLAAAKMHVFRGKPATVAEKTLREWVLRHETNGSAAMLQPQRADKGKARVLVTREWDAGIDLFEADKERIAAEVVKNAKSMIANDGASIREVIRLSEHKLFRLSDVAGSAIAPKDLTALCKLNTKWAGRNDLSRFRMVCLKNKDHKAGRTRLWCGCVVTFTRCPWAF